MKKSILTIVCTGFSLLLYSQQYVAGFEVAREEVLRSVPEEFINKARTRLHIAYQHTSHGTHVTYGMYGLPDYKPGDSALFAISDNRQEGKLELRDYAMEQYAAPGETAADLSEDPETAFIRATRNFLDDPVNAHINVVMWSWCDISWHDVAGNYLPGMDSLISEYGEQGTKTGTGEGKREVPVTFIFMTGHADELGDNLGNERPASQAALINNHCNDHGYFCLDYYSIDTHDMNDTYWEDANEDGESVSYGGNFYKEWQNSHILGEDWYENKNGPGGGVEWGNHNSQHITANRKAYAMWWILARIAGWQEDTTGIPADTIIIPADTTVLVEEIRVIAKGGVTMIENGAIVQMQALILPDSASNRKIAWTVLNHTGKAAINQEGILTAMSEGTVEIVATAEDSSAISGSLTLTIIKKVILVEGIDLFSEPGISEISPGSTLQIYATIKPADATDKSISWSVAAGSGEASVDSMGVLTALSAGTVEVVATARDGSAVAGIMSLTIADYNDITDDDKSGESNFPGIRVFPNPGDGQFLLATGMQNIEKLQLLDLSGKLILEPEIRNAGKIIPLNLTGFSSGIYIIKVYSKDRVIIRTVIKH